ncbi:MAG: PASTA domain-containing protein [Eubacterium sp.]
MNLYLSKKKTDEVEPGIVMEQSPEAGTKVISGSQVKLVVSASMDDINVPNIYNLNEEKAKKSPF